MTNTWARRLHIYIRHDKAQQVAALEDEQMTTSRFHVYAVDGYESAHKTAAAAIRAAKRGSAKRGVLYTVIKCDLYGYTGGGQGVEIWASDGKTVAR
jgi:hypothetical protein